MIDWAPYYKKAVKDVLEGTWQTGQVWWGVKEGADDLVSISSKVPAETKAKLDQVKAGSQRRLVRDLAGLSPTKQARRS